MSSHRRILYVDDNQDSCELVSTILRFSDLNSEVVTVNSAESAIGLIENQLFDFFILDFALPRMSGVELCHQIRKSNSKTPILFFTAMTRPGARDESIAAGANDYLVKPNDLEKLAETVEHLLDKN
jgi:CheY-like chemotaxis protein